MLRDAIRVLKLDRRLVHRRGWIDGKELAQALAELPDVEAKAAEPPPPLEEPPAGRPDES
jgi:hypothetical protein